MMTELPTPAAKRLQRPSWRDSRLVVGVLLVLVAATSGAKLVSSADDRSPVFVASTDLAAGDEITASTFTRVEVKLGEGAAPYLPALGAAPEGSFLLRDVRAGELVPASAVGSAADLGVQRLTVPVDPVSATGLTRGTRVDVYVSDTPTGAPSDAKPKAVRALESVAVVEVLSGRSGLGSSAATSVQLYVPSAEVTMLVEAIDAEAKVTLVPVAGALVGAPS
jgi:hypothetical protein